MSVAKQGAERPAHVPAHLVHEFDIYDVPGSDRDIQTAYAVLHADAPDIFWTPCNGGHWVATRVEHIRAIQFETARFSNRSILIPPPPPGTPKQIPLELDPPVLPQFRRPLLQALSPAAVRTLEEKVRLVAVEAIEGFRAQGRCEFVEDFAKVLPIHVFLDLVDLPRADKNHLLPIAEKAVRGDTAEIRLEAHHEIAAYLHRYIVERREHPGADLLSSIVNTEIDGRRVSYEEAVSFGTLVLFGGLDTVASMLAFFARFLATHETHRREVTARLGDDGFVTGVIEELLRRHGITNTARVVVADDELGGVALRADEVILPVAMLVGLDERANPDPFTVDFNRPKPLHSTFGFGPHLCPGAHLARRELRVFLDEWLMRIPDFRLDPERPPVLATGMVNGVLRLDLVWDS